MSLILNNLINPTLDKTATFDWVVFVFMEQETWKEVDGYNGIYLVSNLGRVKSIDHYIRNKHDSRSLKKGRILKQSMSVKGYLQVSLSKNTKRFSTGAHRLVALHFIPNPQNKPQVNHINGIKHDNRMQNLEWCTNSENQIHAVKNKLTNPNYCEKHHNSKLTNEQVKTARRMHELGWSNIILSKHYNITATAMSNILRKKTYINL